jgi:hypothetical protein
LHAGAHQGVLHLLCSPTLCPLVLSWRSNGQIVTKGQELVCKALIKFLQEAITRVRVGIAPTFSLIDAPLTGSLVDTLLLDLQRMLNEDFSQSDHQLVGIQQN